MGAPAGGNTRTSTDVSRRFAEAPTDDIARIAEAVCAVVGARASILSRVIDDDWLEVVAVSKNPSGGLVPGVRWSRADLTRLLDTAEQLGRLHVTLSGAVSYVEEPDVGLELTRYVPTLLAPLHATNGSLVGVLATQGPVDVGHLPAGACERVELYADQARLALELMREHESLTEHLRMAAAAQAVIHHAVDQRDLMSLLTGVSRDLITMFDARGAWTCAEREAGVHAEAASHPAEVAERLGGDICTLVEPMVKVCWRDDTALTDDTTPLLARLARLAHQERALLAAIGSGSDTRGALLLFRGADDPPWSDRECEALRGIGLRLGVVVRHLEGRQRDRDLVEELRELDQYRRDLVASITHDLKTPLTAIALNTDLLAADGRLVEAGGHPVAAIRRSAERLSGLVDDLLALARAEEGPSGQPVVEADLVDLVRDACIHSEVDAQQRGVTFRLDLPDELRAFVDGDALARVYVNVVSNAVKFSLPDGEIRVGVRRAGDDVEFVCSDDGIGIPHEDQDAVFEMFRRSRDPLVQGVAGSGVGLAISQRIVSRLGGSIHLESTLGQGSTFVVRVPARAADGLTSRPDPVV